VTPPPPLPGSLRDRQPSRIRPRLEPLQAVLEDLGGPQLRYPSILIAGSNGKGSTAAMAAAALRAHGLRIGLYTSPHLLRVEERIQIDGRCMASADLRRHLVALDRFPELTFFETLTAVAFLAFAEARVDCAVLEAGMGGRWDATRLAASSLVGLTNVGTDHRRWLGNDRQAIARDKGSALAAAKIALVGSGVDDDILPHLGAAGALRSGELARVVAADGNHVRIEWEGAQVELVPPLAGQHQLANLELAAALVKAAVGLGLVSVLDPERVAAALASLCWPGRLSRHRVLGRELLVDCAHNLEAARALAGHLRCRGERPNLVFSCLDDKPLEAMAAVLRPLVARVAVCPLDDERAMACDRLADAFPEAIVADDPLAALERLPEPVLAAGSIRLAGALLEHAEEDPWQTAA
jgi:dihydrofolate synthase/folylpolyglutamate synthase